MEQEEVSINLVIVDTLFQNIPVMFDTYSEVTKMMNFSAQKWIYAKKPTFYTWKESLLF